ncbi:MAG: signal peptidase I [Caldilineaceae bacterium]|nr:signal peptidase I [Caldilineaceae bacterium]
MTNRTEQVPDVYALTPEANVEGPTGEPSLEVGTPTLTEAEPQPSMTWMMLRELVETIVLSLVIFLLIRQVVQNYRIESHSMEPNFYEGQFILVNKLAYRLGSPERGDVLVFHNPNNVDEDYIKRVIGLPGDNLDIHDGTVFINGKPLVEEYPIHEIPRSSTYGPVVIEPDHLFVMGDNRPQSQDSRSFGQLSEDLIVGKAWVRVWPFDKFGIIPHYDLEPDAAFAGGT